MKSTISRPSLIGRVEGEYLGSAALFRCRANFKRDCNEADMPRGWATRRSDTDDLTGDMRLEATSIPVQAFRQGAMW
jgi:hypothetical protein